MNKNDLRQLAASALASGATVTRLKTGDTLGLSERDWAAIVRAPHRVNDFEMLHTKHQGRIDPIDQRRWVTLADGREILVNGLGEPL